MHRVTTSRFFTGLFALLMLCATLPSLAQAASSPISDPRSVPLLAEDASVQDLNDQLDLIRQKVTGSANDDLLSTLRQAALQVQNRPTPWPPNKSSILNTWMTSSTCLARYRSMSLPA